MKNALHFVLDVLHVFDNKKIIRQ